MQNPPSSPESKNQDFGFDFVVIDGDSEDGKGGAKFWNDYTETHIIEANVREKIPDYVQKSFEGRTILVVGAKCNSWAERAYPFVKTVKLVFYDHDVIPNGFEYEYEKLPPQSGFYDWSCRVFEF